jgi:hypothetical protein
MDSEPKTLEKILERLWPIHLPRAGEDEDEWKDWIVNEILEELKEINALEEEEKKAAGKD